MAKGLMTCYNYIVMKYRLDQIPNIHNPATGKLHTNIPATAVPFCPSSIICPCTSGAGVSD